MYTRSLCSWVGGHFSCLSQIPSIIAVTLVTVVVPSRQFCKMAYLDYLLPMANGISLSAVLAIASTISLIGYLVKIIYFPPKPPKLHFPVAKIIPGNLTDSILEARKKVIELALTRFQPHVNGITSVARRTVYIANAAGAMGDASSQANTRS